MSFSVRCLTTSVIIIVIFVLCVFQVCPPASRPGDRTWGPTLRPAQVDIRYVSDLGHERSLNGKFSAPRELSEAIADKRPTDLNSVLALLLLLLIGHTRLWALVFLHVILYYLFVTCGVTNCLVVHIDAVVFVRWTTSRSYYFVLRCAVKSEISPALK